MLSILGNGTVWLPEQASTIAPEIDALYYFVYWASLVIFIGVIGTMMYLAYRYRRRSTADRPEPVKENKWIEISWVVVPTILVLLVFNWGFQSFINVQTAPPDAYEIDVRAWQWSWEFEYPDEGVTVGNELHVPVDTPVRLRMTSERGDVLHSLFIPAFRVKHDILPDRYTSLWFEATQEGEYHLFCAEYCGTQHATMTATVVVHSQESFNNWLDEAGVDEDMPLTELGEIVFDRQGCQQCHSLDGTDGVGPSLQGIYESERPMEDGTVRTADENYLRESIVDPGASITEGFQNVMPGFYGDRLSEREISGLIEFIKEQ